MAFPLQFENSNDVGTFIKATNSYRLVAIGGSKEFYNVLNAEFNDNIPVVHASIGNCRIIGRLTAGNKNGLLVHSSTTDPEMQWLQESLPDAVEIRRIDARLSALGNVIACNDKVALVHPELDQETEEIISNVLNVEVFRKSVGNNPLIGTYTVLSNKGCMVPPKTSLQDQEELSALVDVKLATGTVNRGRDALSAGLVVTDNLSFMGKATTNAEIGNILRTFDLNIVCMAHKSSWHRRKYDVCKCCPHNS